MLFCNYKKGEYILLNIYLYSENSREINPRGYVTNPPSPPCGYMWIFCKPPSPLVDPHGL